MSENEDKKIILSTINISKIVKYGLEEDCINLRKQHLSYDRIAEELNSLGKIPEDDSVDRWVVSRYLQTVPDAIKAAVKNNKRTLVSVVNTNMDIIFEVNNLFHKTKAILEGMERDYEEKNKPINVYQWKAVVSEMREMLRQMGDIQKEINDYDNVRRFMEIVIETLMAECPEKVPVIAEKLKMAKGTQWFADILNAEAEK